MAKIIHYCWFGGKPLPKLAKKCIKSWEKYFPDYEIRRWDESNFDVNITEFSKKAYEEKKWAFVSDVARVYALKEYGGIYFDTDMMVVKDVDFLKDEEFFAGWESKDYVAVGALGAKNPNNPIINDLVKKYEEISFDIENMGSFSIPVLLTDLLKKKYGLKNDSSKNQKLANGGTIYTREYFYPLNYDYNDNMFTDNTCMIHYYDASWTSGKDKIYNKLFRMLGRERMDSIISTLKVFKGILRSIYKVLFFPVTKVVNKIRHLKHLKKVQEKIERTMEEIKEGQVIVACNPKWLGTTYATKEMFDNVIEIEELHSAKYVSSIAKIICDKRPKMIVFSAFAVGWEKLARRIKEIDEEIVIKTLWHGSNSMHIEEYDWYRFKEIVTLYKDGIVSSLGFVKKSMAEFYERKGYKTEFLMNNFTLDRKKEIKPEERGKTNTVRIGLYASGDRWVKNFYNQLSATSLVKDAVVECIPISDRVYDFANMINLNLTGTTKPVGRDELFSKMKSNDINVYVTFVECAPMLPLESFELGVPCITGNNHHYWEGHELRDYLVVDEADNVISIYEKIMYCLENKGKIMELYRKWKNEYDIEAKESLNKFLNKDS
jgi:mannosyltransferase OCH1-like enzyme